MGGYPHLASAGNKKNTCFFALEPLGARNGGVATALEQALRACFGAASTDSMPEKALQACFDTAGALKMASLAYPGAASSVLKKLFEPASAPPVRSTRPFEPAVQDYLFGSGSLGYTLLN